MKALQNLQQEKASKFSSTLATSRLLQRKCNCGESAGLTGKCEECQSKPLTLQRQATDATRETSEVPLIVYDVLNSPGQPLDSETCTFMESRFKRDFSQVRVHTDAKAAESARNVNALAYTAKKSIVFGAGQYAPNTYAGKRLLAHELVHILQQDINRTEDFQAIKNSISKPNEASEIEADQVADQIIANLSQAPEQPVSKAFRRINGANKIHRVPTTATQTCGPGQYPPTFSKKGYSFPGEWEHYLIQRHHMQHYKQGSAYEYFIPESGLNGGPGRADIVETNTLSIYEIKPATPGGIFDGLLKIANYVSKAKKHCAPGKGWNRGKSYLTLPDIIHADISGRRVLLAVRIFNGLVVYQWFKILDGETAQDVLVRVRANQTKSSKQKSSDQTKNIEGVPEEQNELSPSKQPGVVVPFKPKESPQSHPKEVPQPGEKLPTAALESELDKLDASLRNPFLMPGKTKHLSLLDIDNQQVTVDDVKKVLIGLGLVAVSAMAVYTVILTAPYALAALSELTALAGSAALAMKILQNLKLIPG